MQLILTVEGFPVEFCVLPASLSDVAGMARYASCSVCWRALQPMLRIRSMNGIDAFVESGEISLLVGRKRNSERRDAHAMRDYKQWFRRRIETVFGEITKLFSQKIHAMALSGFILKISLVLFAYQVDKSFIH